MGGGGVIAVEVVGKVWGHGRSLITESGMERMETIHCFENEMGMKLD